MKQTVLCALLCTVLSSLSAIAVDEAQAQGRPNLVIEMQVEREVYKPDGKGGVQSVREAVSEVQRDDVLVYTLRWRNTGDGEARGAVVSDPVPDGTVLLRGSLDGDAAEVTYSVDGESYFEWPKERIAVDGKTTWKDVPESAVRHIRWRLAEAVPPGGQGEASFKVLVQ